MPNKPKKLNKFRNKIFKILALISVLPLIAAMIVSVYLVLDTRRHNISELQNLAIENARQKAQNFFFNQKISLVISGEEARLSDVAIADVENLALAIKEVDKSIKSLSFIDLDGQELIVRPEGDRQGNVSREAYFITAMKNERYYGPVNYDSASPRMIISAPIQNKNNRIIGAIKAVISLKQLAGELKPIRLGNSGYVYLMDNEGRLIAGSNEKFNQAGHSFKSVPLVASVLGGNSHDGLNSRDLHENINGDRVIFSGKSVNQSSAVNIADWYITSEWPEKDAYSVLDDILKQYVMFLSASVLLVLILGILLIRQIVKPINVLKSGTEEIAKGNLDYSVSLATKDEFELLGENFNKMVKVLKENRRLRDEFVFVAAHELRTPVTAIKGYLSMILDKTFGEVPLKIADSLQIVSQSNERLVHLVQNLLEIARSEAGKMKIDLQAVELTACVTSIAQEIKSLADQKGIPINYVNKTEVKLLVMADEGKLKEVLTNLIGNAVKYTTGSGGVEIHHEEKDNFIITHVKDHGIGISEEDQKSLFAKFYRVQTKDTAKIEGTGLGLFITKQLVEHMGGQIYLASKIGEGSVFSFSLKKA